MGNVIRVWIVRATVAALALAAAALLVLGPRPSGLALPDGTPVRGRVVVTFWEKWTGPEQEALQTLVDAYNTGQSRVFVNLVSVSNINQKTLIATAGGDPPDIAGLWAAQVGPYVHHGAIAPLDELVDRGVVTRETYKPYVWQICAPYGRLYAVSSTPEVMALFWNKAAFREAGLDPETPPRTIAELDAFAAKLTRLRPGGGGEFERIGFLPNEPGAWDYYWGVYFGNDMYDREQDRYFIDTPEQRRAYTWYQGYAKAFGVQNVQRFSAGFGNFNSPQNAFMSGKVAMVEHGPFFCNFIAWNRPGMEYGVAPFPVEGGERGSRVIGDSDVWVIPARARHRREAVEVLAFLSRRENIEALCVAHAKTSPLRDVSPDFYERFPSPYGPVFEKLMYAEHVSTMLPGANWERVQDELFNAAHQIWLGADVGATLRQKQALVDDLTRRQHEMDRRRGRTGLRTGGH